MLKIYNTLTNQKSEFIPLHPPKVGMYVCGVTVYDLCHIGHARTFVNFDVIVRYLRYAGYEVTYVRNITDIDDKIIRRAHELGVDTTELAERFIGEMYRDFDALGIQRPDIEPRATAHIAEIIKLTEELLLSGHAYVAPDHDVVFDIDSYPDYGRLSGQKLDELRAGARVEVGQSKRNPLDFVLWKSSKSGEPAWDSPWGPGRPGWHIECSAMSSRYLGTEFDIHGGGSDLIFPHHENERAQSCSAHQDLFAHTWLHSGMVMINEEKMSKSLNNFFTIRDVLGQYDAETVRYFLLSAQYRSQLNYSKDNLDQARGALKRLYTALDGVTPASFATLCEDEYERRFCACMDDDFNTPGALAVLFDLARDLNRAQDAERAALAARLKQLGQVLGILQQEPRAYLTSVAGDAASELSAEEIEALIAQRQAARAARDFKSADAIREQLKEQGVELEDGPDGTKWRRG